MEELTLSIKSIVENQVFSESTIKSDTERMFDALNILLNNGVERYIFNRSFFSDRLLDCDVKDDFVSKLSSINEKEYGRKEEGRFYTPSDVVEFIMGNAFVQRCNSQYKKVLSRNDCIELLKYDVNLKPLLFDYTVFDPTCGAGEFLVSALETKLNLCRNYYDKDPDAFIKIVNTIYGNDINPVSIEITKIRLFFVYCSFTKDYSQLNTVANILNSNFSVKDFVAKNQNIFDQTKVPKYDIIIGNPPYVEDSKSTVQLSVKYGNIYANVLENSAKRLTEYGVLGFVVPLSYSSTERMHKIRSLIKYYCGKQFILSYADRPDCLFTSVHQKLNIIIGCADAIKTEIYTSGYNYWYKSERNELLSTQDLVINRFVKATYIPKIANQIESEIFSKVLAGMSDYTIANLENKKHNESIYLNMRGCFWMKAFSYPQKSSEYKTFHYDKGLKYYILSLLNSDLFFFFWVAVSDCWHITNKELSSFKVIIQNVDFKRFESLIQTLETKLENTKEFVGTKQTDYVYKHKFCKEEINAIDDALAPIYGLTELENEYLKNYHLKYRISDK